MGEGLDPCCREHSGSARPCEGPGKGQGSGRPPDLAGRGGQRALLCCRGGAKSQAWQTQGEGTWGGVGLGQTRSGPRVGMGAFECGWGQGGAQGLSYLAGWGLLVSSPFGGMVGGGRLDPQHLTGQQTLTRSLGTSRGREAEGEDAGAGGERLGEAGLSRGVGAKRGSHPAGRRGRGERDAPS